MTTMPVDNTQRYFVEGGDGEPITLKYCVNGKWQVSKTEKYMDCYNPSTGEIIARTPCCTKEEVEAAIAAASAAFPGWSNTPVSKRVQVLYKMKALVDETPGRTDPPAGHGGGEKVG